MRIGQIQKKAQIEYIKNPDKVAVISAGEYIVISNGSRGVHIPKDVAGIRYEQAIAVDNNTGEIIEDELSMPDKLLEQTVEAELTNRIGYSEDDDKDICRKIVDKESGKFAYVPIKALSFFGNNKKYRVGNTKWDAVAVTDTAGMVIGMIIPKYVEEMEVIEDE